MAEETVTNFAELEVAVHDNESTPIHLNGATFTMTENLNIDHDCVIDVINQNAVIDGDGSYVVTVKNASATIGNAAGDYTLTFTNGVAEGIRVYAETAATTATFHYCKFSNNPSKGLRGLDGKGFNLTITCNNCEANNNGDDGFTIDFYVDNIAGIGHVILNNCNAKNNTGSSVVNGATAHKAWQMVTINGGEYSGNDGPGLSFVTGSTCIVSDATILNNGQHASSYYQLYFYSGANLLMDGCTVTTAAELGAMGLCFDSAGGVIVHNTEFISNSTSTCCVKLGNNTVFAAFDHCIFRGQTKDSTQAFDTSGQSTLLSIRNCVFYNNTFHIWLFTRAFECTNNIFHTSTVGIVPEADDYSYSRGLTGYNCWYNNTQNIFLDRDSLVSTDIEADPQFIDAAAGNFRLRTGSPCIEGGKQTLLDGPIDIGAWQNDLKSIFAKL